MIGATRIVMTVGLLGCMVLAGGCRSGEMCGDSDSVFVTENAGAVSEFAEAQARAGAIGDTTLYPMHFDGRHINSLGRAKLDLMLGDEDGKAPMTIYLNIPRHDRTSRARLKAVRTYLADLLEGSEFDEISVVIGANPTVTVPAAASLGNLRKTDSSAAGAPAGAETSSGTSGGTSSLVK